SANERRPPIASNLRYLTRACTNSCVTKVFGVSSSQKTECLLCASNAKIATIAPPETMYDVGDERHKQTRTPKRAMTAIMHRIANCHNTRLTVCSKLPKLTLLRPNARGKRPRNAVRLTELLDTTRPE